MPQVNRSALVPYSAEQMYQLVIDILAYPDFLPGCVASKILNRQGDRMTAMLQVRKAGISKTFTTNNQLICNQRVHMQLADGPFRKLDGGWTFTPVSANACRIEFQLDFEFTNKLIEMAFGRIFKELTGNMVHAFIQRAKTIYCAKNALS